MIDEKTLAECELRSKAAGMEDEQYILRLARRYLELKKQFAPLSMDIDGNHSWCWRGNPSRMKGPTFDAAADRLLEGGK